jgi:hypothetical protein
MLTLHDRTSWLAVGLTFFFTVLLSTQVARDRTQVSDSQGAYALRLEMERTQAEVMALEFSFSSLRSLSECEQVAVMGSASAALSESLLPYLAHEERDLYPPIDQMMGKTAIPFTRPLRKELEILRQGVEELERLASSPMTDVNSFIRKGERLLGQAEAHFAVDQSVLYPLIDHEPRAPSIAATMGAASARTPRGLDGSLLAPGQ